MLAILVVVVSIISAPFPGQGNELWHFYVPAFMTFFPGYFYAGLSRVMFTWEKIVLPAVVGIIAAIPYYKLIILLGAYDDDYDRVINETLANLVFYIPNVAIVILTLYLFERYRRWEDANQYGA